MVPDGLDFSALSDVALRNEIRLLETEIAVCNAQIEPKASEIKRSRRIARGTFLTVAGFFGLTLDLISGVIALVGFFDWIDGLREDASATNMQLKLRRRLPTLKDRLALLEAEVRRREAL